MKRLKRLWKAIRLPLFFTVAFALILIAAVFCSILICRFLRESGIVPKRYVKTMYAVIFISISLFFGMILTFFLSKVLAKDVENYIDAVDAVANGDYSVRVQPKVRMAILKKIACHFNHMTQELGSVEMLRNDFVNNFSHEFKTPIVSIRGFARMLKCDDLTPEERDEYLDIIISESERLTTLSTNVLNLSRIEQQSIVTDKKRFNASEQIRLVISLLDHKWANKHIEFSLNDGDVYVTANEEMLQQVWINLLDNAVKFSPDGGCVAVNCEQNGENTTFCFSNAYSDMTEETLSHIFDKFYQGDPSHAVKGNGLGLAIAQEIVKLHDGTITADYDGQTITFTVRLPITE